MNRLEDYLGHRRTGIDKSKAVRKHFMQELVDNLVRKCLEDPSTAPVWKRLTISTNLEETDSLALCGSLAERFKTFSDLEYCQFVAFGCEIHAKRAMKSNLDCTCDSRDDVNLYVWVVGTRRLNNPELAEEELAVICGIDSAWGRF